MRFENQLTFFTSIFLAFNYLQSQGIKTISPCIGELDDGRRVDLSSVDMVSDDEGDYTYKYNPCKAIPCGGSGVASASACQQSTKDPKLSYIIGLLQTGTFSLNGETAIISFTGADNRRSKVTCTCGDSQSFTAAETTPSNYDLRLTHHCCCPNVGGCKKGGGGGGGLSFGSVLVIIFFSLLAAYLIGGIIFMKFVKKAEGKEMIPNYEFWISVPSDFKTGVSFAISKIKGNSGGQYSSI